MQAGCVVLVRMHNVLIRSVLGLKYSHFNAHNTRAHTSTLQCGRDAGSKASAHGEQCGWCVHSTAPFHAPGLLC